MKLKSTLTVGILLFFSCFSFAQMKAVIMGSSTAYGSGASSYSNSWAGRMESFLNQNTSDGLDTIFYNIAQPGYDTYQEMPTGFVPPAGRPLPDIDYNVTKAISYNPEVVIINLPSNDINYGYSKAEMISNLRVMSSTIFAAGIRCYITTPQPRNDLDQSHRDSLLSLVDSVNASFGPYAIDFWHCLVTGDGQNMLRDEYRYPPSPIHVNDAGHELLFEKVRDNYIFGTAGPVALLLTGFNALVQNNSVLIKWHTEQQGSNTGFELQRSTDGLFYETVSIQHITEPRQSSNYAYTDQLLFSGKVFYRLRITESGREYYSAVISVTKAGKDLEISTLISNGTTLTAAINIPKSQFVYINIINVNGAIMLKQKEFITAPAGTLNISVGELPAGQYYMRVTCTDGHAISKPFRK